MGLPTVIGRGDRARRWQIDRARHASMGLPTVIGRGDAAQLGSHRGDPVASMGLPTVIGRGEEPRSVSASLYVKLQWGCRR